MRKWGEWLHNRYSPLTANCSIRFVSEFFRHVNVHPMAVTRPMIRSYIVEKMNCGWKRSTAAQCIIAIKRFYRYSGFNKEILKMGIPKQDKKLPDTLTVSEIFIMLKALGFSKTQTIKIIGKKNIPASHHKEAV